MAPGSEPSDDQRVLELLAQIECEAESALLPGMPRASSDEEAEWLARARHLFKLFAASRPTRVPLSKLGRLAEDAQLDSLASAKLASSTTLPIEWIGSFRLVREIGRGGCGVVYLGIDERLGRAVALKIPFPNVLSSDELRARFLREAKAAAALAHPNIVGVFEAGEMPPILFIASEYCAGGNLAQWLRDQTNQPGIRLAARIVMSLAEAVAHAHERGILHRDLKPGNVLLQPVAAPPEGADADSLPFVPKVADFGLAKIADEAGDATKTGLLFGTIRYMAPEQARGEAGRVGPAADIYSLGAILYELLVGRPPFVGDSELSTLRQIQSDDPLAPSILRPHLPRDLEAVCLKCLEKSSGRRYATAGELAADLRRFLLGQPTLARPTTPVERGWRWLRRHPGAVLSAAAVLALVSLGAFAWHQASERAGALRHSAELDARRVEVEYIADVRHVGQALADLSVGSPQPTQPLREVLAHHIPQGQRPDLRGLEWYHFWQLLHPSRQVLKGHTDVVWSVAWSADGAYLATASRDETARVWNAATGQQLLQLPIAGGASCVVFSPDGKQLVVGAEKDTLVRYRLPDGAPLGSHAAHSGDITWLRYVGSQQPILVSLGRRDALLRAWDTRNHELLFEVPTGLKMAWSAALSPDEKTVVVAGNGGVRFIDLASRSLAGQLDTASEPLAVTYSADGKWLGIAADNRRLVVLDAATLDEVASFAPTYGQLQAIHFSSDGRHVAGAFEDLIFCWEIASGRLVSSTAAAKKRIVSIEPGPGGRLLAVSDFSSQVFLVDGDLPPSPRSVFRDEHAVISDIQWHPDGQTLAICGQEIKILDALSGQSVTNLQLGGDCGNPKFVSCCFPADGRRIVVLTQCPQHNVSLRTFPEGRMLWQKTIPADPWRAAITANGRAIALQTDRGLTFLDLESGQEQRQFPDEGRGTWCAASADSSPLIFSGGAMYEWPAARQGWGKLLWQRPTQDQYTVFSRDGSLVVQAHYGRFDVCDARSGETFFSAPLDVWFRNVDLSPDGRTLVYLSTAARRLHFRRLPAGDELASIRLPWPLLATTAVRCAPNAQRVALMHTGANKPESPAFVLIFDAPHRSRSASGGASEPPPAGPR